jgi:hypothetical protein
MSEDGSEYSLSTPPASPYSPKSCHALLNKVHYPDLPLPAECEKFDDVKAGLQRMNTNRAAHAIAFQGMHPGSAASAMAAREKGQLHHAQIQRRMTNGHPPSVA